MIENYITQNQVIPAVGQGMEKGMDGWNRVELSDIQYKIANSKLP